jgi:hypothetical protein
MLEGALELAKDWSRRGEFLERSAPLPFMSESWSMLWLVVLVGEETSMGSPLLVADMLGTGAETGMMRGPIICGGTVISVVVVWGLAILVAICAKRGVAVSAMESQAELRSRVGKDGVERAIARGGDGKEAGRGTQRSAMERAGVRNQGLPHLEQPGHEGRGEGVLCSAAGEVAMRWRCDATWCDATGAVEITLGTLSVPQDSSRETSLAEPKQLGASVGISGGRGLRGEVVVEAGLVPPEGILSSFWNAANWNRKAA